MPTFYSHQSYFKLSENKPRSGETFSRVILLLLMQLSFTGSSWSVCWTERYHACLCSLLKTSPTSVTEPERKEDEFDLVEGEVVLVEKVQTDGTVEKIVFASGAEVDVYELELLCDKVIWLASHLPVGLLCFSCGFWDHIARNSSFKTFFHLLCLVACLQVWRVGQVGWPRRPPSKVAAALRNSYMVASLHLYRQPPSAGNPLFCNTFCLSYERNWLPLWFFCCHPCSSGCINTVTGACSLCLMDNLE